MPESDSERSTDEPESGHGTTPTETESTDAHCATDRSGADEASPADPWSTDVWSAGSYEAVAPKYASMGGQLVERTGVDGGDDVLDVGCGTGTVAVTAARRDARVTGLDITPELLERARGEAAVAGVEEIDWRTGDAAAMPFEADAFDATLSNLGHMYGEPPEATAEELLRVTRPGGRIGFTAWTPGGLYPAMASVVATFLTPEDLPDFSAPPFTWGDPDTVRERLEPSVEELEFTTATMEYPALSPEHVLDETATNSGPFSELLDAVDDGDLPAVRERLVETIERYFDDAENAVELEYLLTTATVTEAD